MKQFLIILGLTVLVWFGVSWSETSEYPITMHVQTVGYDTVRYAVVSADSTLTVSAAMTGYDAFFTGLRRKAFRLPVGFDGSGFYRAVATADLFDDIRGQLKLGSSAKLSAITDSVRLLLSERAHRTYRPSIERVQLAFDEQYGLYGEPKLSPQTITLYGPEEHLDAIDSITAKPAKIVNISSTSNYSVELDPIWTRFPDVHPSATAINIEVPVAAFVERQYQVPITVVGADSNVRLRLYPEQVTVQAWIALCDVDRNPDFEVSIRYSDVLSQQEFLQPTLTRFPSYLRPRDISPQTIQCVIIK